jgi:tol-pal system-associated acyl-CoA thioesterase
MTELVLPVRIYLEDTDAQSVVYNASYFRFMERARTEWLRARGVDHDELLGRYRLFLVLTRVEADFKAPARLGDLLHVAARVTVMRGARVTFEHDMAVRERGGRAVDGPRVCRASAEVACMNADHGRPQRLPPELLNEWSR